MRSADRTGSLLPSQTAHIIKRYCSTRTRSMVIILRFLVTVRKRNMCHRINVGVLRSATSSSKIRSLIISSIFVKNISSNFIFLWKFWSRRQWPFMTDPSFQWLFQKYTWYSTMDFLREFSLFAFTIYQYMAACSLIYAAHTLVFEVSRYHRYRYLGPFHNCFGLLIL